MPEFLIQTLKYPLHLKEAFTISRGTKEIVQNVFVKISADGIAGYGEAAPNRRYREDAEEVINFVERLAPEGRLRAETLTDLLNIIHKQTDEVHSAAAALEMAWWDWFAKLRDQPLWKLWGSETPVTPVTSYTIGIDEPDVMQQKVVNASQFPVFKVKLGTGHDREIIQALRRITDKPLRIDANEGWDSLEHARDMIRFLADKNVELIEQPMPSSNITAMKELKKWSPLPLYADESFTGVENISQIAGFFHGINIKLMKAGSLKKSLMLLKNAQRAGMKVMIGCMIESSLAISAGALLGLMADIVDLDGFLLVKNDPFEGITLTPGSQIRLADRAGLGITSKANIF